jgi:hypothetical protein
MARSAENTVGGAVADLAGRSVIPSAASASAKPMQTHRASALVNVPMQTAPQKAYVLRAYP